MAEVTELTENRGKTYLCKTCKTQFMIPRTETAVCCPVCRMNRISSVE